MCNTKLGATPVLLYIIMGILTFAYIQVFAELNEHSRDPASVLGGIVWPIYWPATSALLVMQKLKANSIKAEIHTNSCIDTRTGKSWAAADGICYY